MMWPYLSRFLVFTASCSAGAATIDRPASPVGFSLSAEGFLEKDDTNRVLERAGTTRTYRLLVTGSPGTGLFHLDFDLHGTVNPPGSPFLMQDAFASLSVSPDRGWEQSFSAPDYGPGGVEACRGFSNRCSMLFDYNVPLTLTVEASVLAYIVPPAAGAPAAARVSARVYFRGISSTLMRAGPDGLIEDRTSTMLFYPIGSFEDANAVPEPATWFLSAAGLACLSVLRFLTR